MSAPQPDDNPTPLEAALAYARRGWRVIPIPPGLKFPQGFPAWQREGSTDEAKIRHWWGQAPDHGIGIVTGATSGLWVLDVDVADGKRGDETLAELIDAYGPLPDTYEVVTGSGGRHIYFAWPHGQTIRNSASGRLGPGLDVRGEGGFVVAPPSIHANGTAYELEASSTVDLAHSPGWMLAKLDEPEPQARRSAPSAAAGDRPGDLWAASTTWAEILEPDGWQLDHVDRDNEHHWVRPGKDKREGTSATTGYKGSDVLKVFTSSMTGVGLHADETYTKIGYYAATRFGDTTKESISAAAKALRADGYHAPPLPDLDDMLGDSLKTPRVPGSSTPVVPASKTITWRQPTAIPDAPQPDVPVDAFPTWIAAQIHNATRQLGCDPVLPLIFGLGALSVASLGHLQIKVRAGETLRNTGLYLAASGVPATGKSPALDFMIDPVRDHEEQCIEHAKATVAEAEAAKSIALKKANEAIDSAAKTGDPDRARDAVTLRAAHALIDTPPAGELMTTNITPEKVATLMQANGERIAIVSDESGVLNVDRYGDKKGGSNMDIYLQGFTGQPVVVHRQNAPPVRMRHPLMAIVAGVQPEALTAAMGSDEFRNRGLGPRFLTVSTTKLATNTDIDLDLWDEGIATTYDDKLTALAKQWSSWATPATLTIAPDARRTYSTWAADLRRREGDGGQLEGESGWVSKLRSSTIRIAALFHLADGASHDAPISDEALQRAIRVAEFFVDHHTRDTSTTPQRARTLLSTLVRLSTHEDAIDGLVTKRLVARLAPPKLRKPDQFYAPMAVLVDCGWVALEPDTLHFAESTEAAVAAAKGFRVHPDAPRDSPRHGATAATKVDGESPDQDGSHSASTDVALVAHVAISDSQTPSLASFSPFREGSPEPARQARQTPSTGDPGQDDDPWDLGLEDDGDPS